MDRFETCLAQLLREEGGYVDDPNDAGGKTNFGVTEGVLREAHRLGIVASDDVARLSPEEATAIYRRLYWETARCDLLPEPLDQLLFDAAVNCGVGAAVKFLQSALVFASDTAIAVDGAFGPETRGALASALCAHRRMQASSPEGAHPDLVMRAVALAMLAERAEHYLRIVDGRNPDPRRREQEIRNRAFLRGWMERLGRQRKLAGV